LREAHILCRLNHDNILPFLGVCFAPGPGAELALVMPWVDKAMTLGKFLRQPNKPKDADRCSLLTDVARALVYLHADGAHIVHGDLYEVRI
ncbi:hypothetical protein AURDEDRAFT_25784, partial [Auricularia subglabra TFB-10046 SS5]